MSGSKSDGGSQPYVLTTSAGPHALREIEAALQDSWAGNPHVPEDVRMKVGIAVGEVAANIVEHAAGANPVQIHMEVRILTNEVWVEFVDDGDPAHVDLNAVSMPGELSERGRGLALAQAVLARLMYRRDLRNHWTLVSQQF